MQALAPPETCAAPHNLGGVRPLSDKVRQGQTGKSYFEVRPRLLVCFTALFSLGSGLVVYQAGLVWLLFPYVVLAGLSVFDLSKRWLLWAAIALVLGMFNAQLRTPGPGKDDISKFAGEQITVTGEVLRAEQLRSGKGMRVLVACRKVECDSPFAVQGNALLNLFYGRKHKSNEDAGKRAETLPTNKDQVRFSARLIGINKMRFKNGSQKFVLAEQGIYCQSSIPLSRMKITKRSQVDNVESLDKAVSKFRQQLVDQHRLNLGVESGNLLASMVLGDKAVAPGKEITDSFRAAGLSHILAASGFNLSVVATAIYFLTRYLGNLWLANAVCFMGMSVFVLVAGPSPSVVRAFLMGSLLLFSRCISRTAHLPAVLSFSMLIVVLVDPAILADIGFQLSYVSTAGMIVGANEFGLCLSRLRFLRACPEWIKQVLAGTLVAQACVLPVQLYYFEQFNPYCLIANVLVTPMIPAISIAGFAGSFCFALELGLHSAHMASAWIDKICFYPLELIRFIVLGIASWPYAESATRQPDLPVVLIYYCVLLAFPLFQLKLRMRLWSVVYLMVLAILVLCAI